MPESGRSKLPKEVVGYSDCGGLYVRFLVVQEFGIMLPDSFVILCF